MIAEVTNIFKKNRIFDLSKHHHADHPRYFLGHPL